MAKDPHFVRGVIARMEMSGKRSNYIHQLLNRMRVGKTIAHREIKEAIARLWLRIEEGEAIRQAATELIDFVIDKYDVKTKEEFTCPHHRNLNDLLGDRTLVKRKELEAVANETKVEKVDYKAKFELLAEAVEEFYNVGHWKCDRVTPKPEHIYFEQLRDAAGIEPGHAPKPNHPEQQSLDLAD